MEGFVELFQKLGDFFKARGNSIIVAIALLIVGCFIITYFCKGLLKVVYATKIDNAVGGFFVALIKIMLYIFLVFLMAWILGVEGNSFLVALSSVMVAVALALKDSLSNIANGIIIIMTKPFKKGDHVNVNGVEGLIKNIRVMTTELISFDNKKIVIPNNSVISSNIINYTANPTRRLEFTFGVSYDSDMTLVKKKIIEAVTEFEFVLDYPAPIVYMKAHSASSIDFELKVWVNTSDYWPAIGKINESVFNKFKAANIEIPYQQIDMHFRNDLTIQGGEKKHDELL